MNVEQIRDYCLSLHGVTEDMPFGNNTLVFRVMNKIFILLNLEGETSINLKCEPSRAIELREQYSSIIPGYHMNKKHWNTLIMDGSLKTEMITSLIDHSYELIVKSLSGSDQKKLKQN